MKLLTIPKIKPGIAKENACKINRSLIAFFGRPKVLIIPNSYVLSSTLEFINE